MPVPASPARIAGCVPAENRQRGTGNAFIPRLSSFAIVRGRFCAWGVPDPVLPCSPFSSFYRGRVQSRSCAARWCGEIVSSRDGVIEFKLEVPSHVRIDVIDIGGRTVATLVDEMVPAGAHHYRWDSRGFPSGVYFYSVRSADYLKSGKILVMPA